MSSNIKSVSHPIHKHDCECCTFLGNYAWKESVFDLYICPRHQELIARHGEDGDYFAAPEGSPYPTEHPLGQAQALKVVNDKMVETRIIEMASEVHAL